MDFKTIWTDIKKNWLSYLIDIGNYIYENIINKKNATENNNQTEEYSEELPTESDEIPIEETQSTDENVITPENWQEYLDPKYYYEPNDCINCRLEKEDQGLKFTNSVHWNTEERLWVCDKCGEFC